MAKIIIDQPNTQDPASDPRNYAAHSTNIYREGMLDNKLPVVTTNPTRLEEQARRSLGINAFNYVAGGAGEKSTMDANRLAFRQWKIVPRMLRPSTHHDLRSELFGFKLNSPVFMSPVGVHGIFHVEREPAAAAAAQEVGVPYSHSTAATTSIEEAARANGDGLRFYQLYWPHNDALTVSFLQRARASGYKVLLVTLDTWHIGWRPDDLDDAYVPFSHGIGIQVMTSDPVFRKLFAERFDGKTPEEDLVTAGALWSREVFPGKAHTWDELKLLRDNWDGPIVLKGIQHVEDAKLAIEHGMDGIYISNHGGRQVDGAIGSLDALAEIAEAVGDKTTIMFDSGIRTGSDVIKALSLGAHAVGIGRPWVYGLAINGRQGVKQVLSDILADFDLTLGLVGATSLKDLNRSLIRKVVYPGDRHANN